MDDRCRLHGQRSGTILISVVVCTYNPKDDVLARALDAILAQDFDAGAWELLVVDNNSSSAVSSRPFIRERGIRVLVEPRQGLSAAREFGVAHTQGDIIVFVDDDNMISSEYLRTVSAIFTDSRIGVISGTIVPEYEKIPGAWFKHEEGRLAIRRPPTERTYLTNIPLFNDYFPVGAGMAVRRGVITSYFQSIAEGSSYIPGRVGSQLSAGEDIDLDFFAISEGYLVGTAGSLKLIHMIPAERTSSNYLVRLAIGSTESAAEVNRKWAIRFGCDVFESFTTSRRKLRLQCMFAACRSWNPHYKVRYHSLKTLLRVTGVARRTAPERMGSPKVNIDS